MIAPNKKIEIGKHLTNTDMYATCLLAIVLDIYGTEALNWDPLTLVIEIEQDFNIDLPAKNENKLMALITAITSDVPFNDYIAFNYMCEALTNDPIDPDIFDPVDPSQMAWSVSEVRMHYSTEDFPEFHEDIARYVGSNLNMYGILKAPKVLDFAIYPPENTVEPDSDDADMSKSVYERNRRERQEIEDTINLNLQRLLDQLTDLPLVNKDQESWKKFNQALNR